MTKLINLQGVIIYKVEEDGQQFTVKIGQPRAPVKCRHCNNKEIIKHGKGKERKLRHGISISGKQIILKWKSKRYKCKQCKKTWSVTPTFAFLV